MTWIFSFHGPNCLNCASASHLFVKVCVRLLPSYLSVNFRVSGNCIHSFSESIDLLILSLKHAQLSDGQIPTLFFLAETVIYWIRTDIIDKPLLRSFELKLLKVRVSAYWFGIFLNIAQ